MRIQILLLLFVGVINCDLSKAQSATPVARTDHSQNSLAEIHDKRSALLVVLRTGMVDASDNEHAIIDLVLKADPRPRGRYQWVYGTLTHKLNNYIRKYRSLS